MLNLKMVLLIFHIFFLSFLGLTVAGQESIQLFHVYTATPEAPYSNGLAVSVTTTDLNEVSSSVLMAESWLRGHVLAHYPATEITTIVVGNTLCHIDQDQQSNFSLVLPSLKNLQHSLTRWGLEKDIKVSVSISSSCLHPNSTYFDGPFAHKFTRPLLEFLDSKNSTYSVYPPPNFSASLDETKKLVSSHSECMKKIGFLELKKMNFILTNPKESVEKRKLTSFPTRPNPLPKTSDPPLQSSVGFSVPSNVANHPQPPQAHLANPPEIASNSHSHSSPPPHFAFPSTPEIPPVVYPARPPYSYTLPPCNPSHAHPVSPPPNNGNGIIHKLWCVAKPTVPADTLQAAMDYACGEGGADCDEIMPNGNCYSPDTVVAHASFAFNSYWQKNKRNGGTCSFGGTAMLINNDPSYLHCQFILT